MTEINLDKGLNGSGPAQQFAIQRIYLKDASVECPNTPQIFQAEWKPNVSVELTNNTKSIAKDTYEVQLTVTVTVKLGDEDKKSEVAYLVEVKQCGIFHIQGFGSEEMNNLLGSYCPTILFPFVRECIADLIQRAGFPAFYLQPVNFEAIYAQQKQRQEKSDNTNNDKAEEELSQTRH